MLHEFMEHQLLFRGINFDPVFTAFALCPVAAAVAIAVGQTCTAPLSRIAILSQVTVISLPRLEERLSIV
ncbi:unnamed protein product [Linum trigynum]|uniref:Uncharacterized protein n=1 Tax=Linum trigynum TaxID=586398 RepID=A0AAV2G0Y6_9ROSI